MLDIWTNLYARGIDTVFLPITHNDVRDSRPSNTLFGKTETLFPDMRLDNDVAKDGQDSAR